MRVPIVPITNPVDCSSLFPGVFEDPIDKRRRRKNARKIRKKRKMINHRFYEKAKQGVTVNDVIEFALDKTAIALVTGRCEIKKGDIIC